MAEITYTRQGDYNLPNLLPPQEEPVPHGKYALLRRKFLKEHRRITYTNLLTSGKLNSHLAEIQQTAQRRMEQMVAQMAKENGVTEELKEHDQMKWVGLMNNLQNTAEEVVLAELIYN
ncbi:MAG: TnpV protein [Oscillospiraceae bacterium]